MKSLSNDLSRLVLHLESSEASYNHTAYAFQPLAWSGSEIPGFCEALRGANLLSLRNTHLERPSVIIKVRADHE